MSILRLYVFKMVIIVALRKTLRPAQKGRGLVKSCPNLGHGICLSCCQTQNDVVGVGDVASVDVVVVVAAELVAEPVKVNIGFSVRKRTNTRFGKFEVRLVLVLLQGF